MLRIVIDARELRTSSGRYVERLLHYLQQIDHEHDYQILLKPEDMAGWQPSNSNFVPVACPHKEFSWDEQLGLKRQIETLRPDLVHFCFAQQPILYHGHKVTTLHDLTTLRFRNPDKQPLVFWVKQHIYGHVIKRAARSASHLLTPTQFVKDDIIEFTSVNPEKITVTYESADPITDPPEPISSLQNTQFIMYVGRPTPHKNLERLVEAFGQLQKQHPKLQLALAGKLDANYRRLKQIVQKANKQGIVFTDKVSEGQLRWLYEHCAAYIYPSLSEGFGLPGLEAMMHGAPVVSSNATCLPEVYGTAAHYFDPLDVTAIATAIDQMLRDTNLRTSLITAGHAQVEKYSWQRMAEQTLAIYRASID
jgi:glycosyltransferase involved in cell wall biosynthesis